MTKLTGVIKSESKLTGSLGVRNEINVDIIGTGARGKSAYESWLGLGNEGTEQEYLASLKGRDGDVPIKGVDYYTDMDRAEIVSQIIGVVKSDAEYVHDQISASNAWEINHDLDKYPSVNVVDTANNLVMGDVKYVSKNTIVLTFAVEFSGKAFLN